MWSHTYGRQAKQEEGHSTFKSYIDKFEAERLGKIQLVKGEYPLFGKDYAGKKFSFDTSKNRKLYDKIMEEKDEVLRKEKFDSFSTLNEKYPNGVEFTEKGFPDFSPYAQKTPKSDGVVNVSTKGNRDKDFEIADSMAGIDEDYRDTYKLVWHHHEDTQTMILLNRDIHKAITHSGGISVYFDSINNLLKK